MLNLLFKFNQLTSDPPSIVGPIPQLGTEVLMILEVPELPIKVLQPDVTPPSAAGQGDLVVQQHILSIHQLNEFLMMETPLEVVTSFLGGNQ